MIDIPRLFTAIAEWGVCVLCIIFNKKRTGVKALISLFVLWLAVFIGWQYGVDYFPLILWPLGMTGAVILMIAFVYSCSKVKLIDAATWGICVFIVAEFIAAVEWQLYYYIYNAFEFARAEWFKYFCFIIIYAVCFCAFTLIERKLFASRENGSSYKSLFTVTVIVLVCFIVSNISFLNDSESWDEVITRRIFEIRTLVDICGVCFIYSFRILTERACRQEELNAMQDLLDKQYRQYCQFKENDAVISRQYHDLKHQIDVILSEKNADKRAEYLKEMRRSIKTKQIENKTGNEVMDIVLTGKMLGCVDCDVNFSVVADGKLLNFMSTMDLCTVLGNALDNAIENVLKIAEPEKRLIQLALFEQEGFTVLRIKNYYENALNFENGELVTTKEDAANHGYGLKSIRAVTEKYGGNLKADFRDNWFTLCLLFPVQKS